MTSGVHVEAIWLFHRAGLWGASRMLHVIVGIMWMGLLWFFNMVQTPAYAEMEASARNNAFDKLTWRALWWFRWAAIATLVTGIFELGIGGFKLGDPYHEFWKTGPGMMLIAAIIFAFIMAYNVWMVIWPAQQIVIANARTVAAGGEANPDAPKAARRGAMASRQNTIFSFTVFLAMIGACIISSIMGALIPLALKRLGFDPATASAIFLTTATDVSSMGLFLLLATMWLT